MSEYTPTRNEILTALVHYRARGGDTPPPPISDLATPEETARYLSEAEAGLAEVERKAAEKAWEEGWGARSLNPYSKANPYRREDTE